MEEENQDKSRVRFRSLTASEKAAEACLGKLRVAGLAPGQPYNLVKFGEIKRINLARNSNLISDLHERQIVFKWEPSEILQVAITLRQHRSYSILLKKEYYSLDDSEKCGFWRVETIEITVERKRHETQLPNIGKILFDNPTAISLIEHISSGVHSPCWI